MTDSQKVGGVLGYFGLAEWWLTAFSKDEQKYVLERFNPLGGSGSSLIEGEISYTTQTAVGLLSSLAGWFGKEADRPIAHKILEKAVSLIDSDTRVLSKHFLFQAMLEIYYKDRDDPNFLMKAVDACKRQIALAPEAAVAFKVEYPESPLPSHKGFSQMAIILEKREKFAEAVVVCDLALSQGWAGDWERRIDRCNRKNAKS